MSDDIVIQWSLPENAVISFQGEGGGRAIPNPKEQMQLTYQDKIA